MAAERRPLVIRVGRARGPGNEAFPSSAMVALAPFLAIFGIKRVSKFRRRWTERKRRVIQSSWAALLSAHGDDPMATGSSIFRKLFTGDTAVLRLFPFRNQARTLFVSAHFKLHAKLFVDTMTELIANLHDLEKVERDVRALGKRHLTYGVQPAHFDAMGEALIAVLDESCHHPSDEVTLDKEERDAWSGFWGFIAKEAQRGRKGIIASNPGSRPGSPRASEDAKPRAKGGMSAA